MIGWYGRYVDCIKVEERKGGFFGDFDDDDEEIRLKFDCVFCKEEVWIDF